MKDGKYKSACTFVPPSFAHAKILPVLAPGRATAFLPRLRNGVVSVPSAFFHQVFTGAVCNIGFCS